MYVRNNKCTRTKPSSQGRGGVLAGQSRREGDLEQRLKGTKGASEQARIWGRALQGEVTASAKYKGCEMGPYLHVTELASQQSSCVSKGRVIRIRVTK